MSRRFVPADWGKPLEHYQRKAVARAIKSADQGDRSVAESQAKRHAERVERDRREMAAIVGREFLP